MSAWSGPRATRARARVAARLPAPCTRCGLDVDGSTAWDVDHVQALAQGGSVWDPSNHGPAHAACNRSAGATMGNHLRSGRGRRLPRLT